MTSHNYRFYKRLRGQPHVLLKQAARLGVWLCLLGGFSTGCGTQPAQDGPGQWFASPEKVIEGIMHAYETRDDSLYAALLADGFRYYFEPAGADSADILGWGKEEEVVATGNLFHTVDIDSLSYSLQAGNPRPADGPGREGWMQIPVTGGRMTIVTHSREPMEVLLNRQVIYLNKREERWQIIEWRDYPEGDLGDGEG